MENIVHTSPLTKGTYCDGRPCFEVLVRRRRGEWEEAYYCTRLRSYFDPEGYDEDSCPRSGDPKPWKGGFNRGWKRL